MAHLDSNTIRPLYDVKDGGPPLGFRCMQTVKPYFYSNKACTSETCMRVTRTYRGMIAHQRIVHGVKQQGELPLFDRARPLDATHD